MIFKNISFSMFCSLNHWVFRQRSIATMWIYSKTNEISDQWNMGNSSQSTSSVPSPAIPKFCEIHSKYCHGKDTFHPQECYILHWIYGLWRKAKQRSFLLHLLKSKKKGIVLIALFNSFILILSLKFLIVSPN